MASAQGVPRAESKAGNKPPVSTIVQANEPAAQKPNTDVPELELLLAFRFQHFILKPSHVAKAWKSSHMKEDLISIFQEHFKPKSSIEQEKVEYNEINIFSEY